MAVNPDHFPTALPKRTGECQTRMTMVIPAQRSMHTFTATHDSAIATDNRPVWRNYTPLCVDRNTEIVKMLDTLETVTIAHRYL